MSIATTAPEKYALQDIACIELMLRFARAGSATFTIESGIEDGDLVLGSGADAVHYEVQVKGAAGAVGIAQLGQWLLHFPAFRHDDTVLERLIRDSSRYFVLVASGRCGDDLQELIAGDGWLGEAHDRVSDSLARLVIQEFGRSDTDDAGDTALHKARVVHRNAAAKKLRLRAVAAALRRVVVLEHAVRPRLEERICAALVRRGLPPDRCAVVTAGMRGVVDAARGAGTDAMGAVEAYLRTVLPRSLRPRDYEARGDEALLVDELVRESRVLLSGIARSGKSTAALWLASEFETRGFEVRRTGSVEAAEAFLDDPAASFRLAVLDDPLGGAHPVPRPEEALQRLAALVRRASDGRRIVVSQGQERLLATTRQTSLADALVGGVGWHNLSAPSANFLASLWLRAAERHGFPPGLRDEVSSALSSGALVLGAGAIDFLARDSGRLPPGATVDDAARLARTDASSLGDALLTQARSPTCLKAVLIASDARGGVRPVELAFVQGAGGDALPGLTEHLGTSYTLGGGRREKKVFPDYATAPATDAGTRSDLDALERLNVIESGSAGAVAFSHPFYREAVEAALRNPTAGAADELMALHRRALFARESATSRAAARNLDMLLHLMTPRPDGRGTVFARAVEGLRAYFPPTRDLCFDFLMRHLAEASAATGQREVEWLHRVTHVDLDELQWHGGEATLPVDGEIDDRGVWRFLASAPRRSAVAATLAALDGSGPLPSPQDSATALRHLTRYPGRMTMLHAERLLSYEEGVLRGAAARRWLSEPRLGDGSVLARLARDRHPLVALGCLRGVEEALAHCAAHRRGELASLLVRLAGTPALALALMDRLTVFERDGHADRGAAWRLFAPVMAAAMRSLPAETSFDKARLYNVMDWAWRRMPPRNVAAIAREWIGWLERSSAAGRHLGSFATGVVTILVAGTRLAPAVRGDLLERALALRETGAFLRLAADAVDDWDLLRADEREALAGAIAAPARDARWRRAVALTRRRVPPALEVALMPVGTRLADGASALLTSLPVPVLEACLAVHCACPGRLHEVSLRDRESVWEAVVALVAMDGRQPMLATVFGHVAAEHDEAKVTTMVAAGMRHDPEATFRLLMAETMHRDLPHLAGGWRYLLAHAPSEADRERWLDEVRDAASRIFEERRDVDELFPEPALAAEVWARLGEDTLLATCIVAVLELRGPMPEDLRAPFYRMVLLMLAKAPPRILGTVDDVFGALRQRQKLPAELEEAVQATRVAIINAGPAIDRRWDAEREAADWVEPRRAAAR